MIPELTLSIALVIGEGVLSLYWVRLDGRDRREREGGRVKGTGR